MSKSFKFGLEKLLDIRKEKEEESKRLFTQSQNEMELTKNKLNEMQNNYDKYNGINKGESLAYQKIKKNYLFALSKGINSTEKELEQKVKAVDYRREDLKRKQVERKTVDKLKEKQLREFTAEQNRLEQVANDEFALYSYIRNTRKEVSK